MSVTLRIVNQIFPSLKVTNIQHLVFVTFSDAFVFQTNVGCRSLTLALPYAIIFVSVGDFKKIMFDPPEEVRDITILPIYVWDKVLLPFVKPVPVRVKEPHLRKMIADLTVGESYFGMVFRWMRDKETGLPYRNATGCIAKLLSNRFNRKIEVKGMARFRIVKYLETDKPYPVAEIKFFEEERRTEFHYTLDELIQAMRETFETINRLANKLAQEAGLDEKTFHFDFADFDPIEFSFQASIIFNLDEGDYLKLLNLMDPVWRYRYIRETLEELEENYTTRLERSKFLKLFLNFKDNPNLD